MGKDYAIYKIKTDIPALEELKKFAHWVVWKKEKRGDKLTKVPYKPNGQLAKSNDPQMWSVFHVAASSASRFDGIGFVFSDSDPYLFIDLDHVLDENKEIKSEWARKLVDALDSYTEISPSGDGLHIFAKGEIPSGWKKRKHFDDGTGVEVYQSGRYSTVTLNIYEDRKEIKPISPRAKKLLEKWLKDEPQNGGERQGEEIKANPPNIVEYGQVGNSLSDDEIIQKLIKDGYWREPREGDDWSALDQGLCNKLAFWTNKNAEQMDRIFRKSPLMRTKWDEKHRSDGATYGQMTIEEAIRKTTSGYNPSYGINKNPFLPVKRGDMPKGKRIDFKAMREDRAEIKERAMAKHLYKGLVVEGHHIILVSPSGGFKTTIAINVAVELAKRGYEVHYWALDPSIAYLRAMVEIIEEEGIEDNFFIFTKLHTFREAYTQAIELNEDMTDRVIIIDTLKKVLTAVINKNTNVKDMAFLREITNLGASILSLHHTNKDKEGERGKKLDNAGTAEMEQDTDGILFIESVDRGNYYLAQISKKHRRVRFTDRKLCFKLRKYEPSISIDDPMYEIDRAYHFIRGCELLPECKEDISTLRKIEENRPFIETVQAILRRNGGEMIQKDLVSEVKDELGIGKDRCLEKLSDKDFLGKFWRYEHGKEKNKKVYRLIDTTEMTAQRLNRRIKESLISE